MFLLHTQNIALIVIILGGYVFLCLHPYNFDTSNLRRFDCIFFIKSYFVDAHWKHLKEIIKCSQHYTIDAFF